MAHQSSDAGSMASRQSAMQDGDPDVTDINELFYKVLIVLQTLAPSTCMSKTHRSAWQEFLDSLSWICDEKPGGKTVTPIAISRSTCGLLIWMACNDKSNGERVVHLENMFGILGRLDEHPPLSRESEAAIIAEDTIRRGYRRVLNYMHRRDNKLQDLEAT
jgi:hypothetical protein